tara:strand:- start:2799 stop:2999 length:201 start_codon:yes stop_codon:yes gene_type:complete
MMDEELNNENVILKKKIEKPPDKLQCFSLVEAINNYFMQSGIYILDKPNDNCNQNFVNMIRTFMYK